MIKGRKKIVVAILFLFLILLPFGMKTYAAINESYSANAPVQEGDLDGKMKNSIILEAISSMIYAVASWVESLIGAVFEMLTGNNMFPWADQIIFNTIPFLDVNFLNPAPGSLFKTSTESGGTATPLANIVVNIYSTVFTLAVTFLGVVVGLMAIKLALSSLASEKAKYKEALMKFLFSLVALFGMHYAMSFIFYINESMVVLASEILTENLENTPISLNLEISNDSMVKNFVESNPAPNIWQDIVSGVVTCGGSISPSIANHIASDSADDFILDTTEDSFGVSNIQVAGELLQNTTYRRYRIKNAHGNDVDQGWVGFGRYLDMFNSFELEAKIILVSDIATIKNESEYEKIVAYYEEFENIDMNSSDKNKLVNDIKATRFFKESLDPNNFASIIGKLKDDPFGNFGDAIANAADYYKGIFTGGGLPDKVALEYVSVLLVGESAKELQTNVWKHMIYVHKVLYEGEERTNDVKSLLANMGEFFKKSAWTYETNDEGEITGWTPSQVTLQGAILYAMFITQSLMFFFAYLKRFFYVVILAMLAPVIVIYDFLGKIMS